MGRVGEMVECSWEVVGGDEGGCCWQGGGRWGRVADEVWARWRMGGDGGRVSGER